MQYFICEMRKRKERKKGHTLNIRPSTIRVTSNSFSAQRKALRPLINASECIICIKLSLFALREYVGDEQTVHVGLARFSELPCDMEAAPPAILTEGTIKKALNHSRYYQSNSSFNLFN